MYLIAAAVLVVGGIAAWLIFSGPDLPAGFAGGNGRLEANQIYVATKYPGASRTSCSTRAPWSMRARSSRAWIRRL